MKTLNSIPSQPYDFTVRGILKEAWKLTYGAKETMWVSIIIYFIISSSILFLGSNALSYWFSGEFTAEAMNYYLGIQWLRWLILFPMHTGILLLAVRRSLHSPIQARQIFTPYKYYFSLLMIGLLLYFLISLSRELKSFLFTMYEHGGAFFILLDVFLTFFCSLWLTFAALLVVEKQQSTVSALKISIIRFKQHWLKIILIMLFIVMPYFIIANVLFFIPPFMVLGATPIFWTLWGVLTGAVIIASVWLIPMFLNIGGILYRTMFRAEFSS